MAVRPPSDMPTTTRARGAWAATTAATSSARFIGLYAPSARQSECPWPGRSTATAGRPSANATVSQVWAFWAPPWRYTISGSSLPHRSALIERSSTFVSMRATGGNSATSRSNSSMFSWKSPNSS